MCVEDPFLQIILYHLIRLNLISIRPSLMDVQ